MRVIHEAPIPALFSGRRIFPGSVSDQGTRKVLAPSLAGAGWLLKLPFQ